MHISLLADDLRCYHCHEPNSVDRWPLHGDHVPLYFQKEPGRFSLDICCPHCKKNWYVVWDQDPGSIERLGLF